MYYIPTLLCMDIIITTLGHMIHLNQWLTQDAYSNKINNNIYNPVLQNQKVISKTVYNFLLEKKIYIV